MKTSKLVTYLKSLSKKEIRLFDDFINSPFHNKSDLVTQLWTYLKRYAPAFEHKKLEKSLIIKHLYQENTPNSLKRFNDLTVTVCKLFEQYIQIQHLANNKNYQDRILVNAFGERQLNKAFYKTIDSSKRKINKKSVKDVRDYELLLFLETKHYYYLDTSKFDLDDTSMQTMLGLTDSIAVMLKMKYTFEARQTELFINKKFDIAPINLKIEQVSNYENNLLLIIFDKQIKLLEDSVNQDVLQ